MGRGGGGSGHSSGGSHSHSSGSSGSSHSHSSFSSGGGGRSHSSFRGSSSGRGSSFSDRNRSSLGTRGNRGGYPPPPSRAYNCPPPPPPRRKTTIERLLEILCSFLILIMIEMMLFTAFKPRSKISASTIPRERVETKNAYINDCIIDEIGWINNKTKLASKLKQFYQETGCQPYIYLMGYDEELYDSEDARMEWSKNYYDTNFAENQNVVLYTYFCDKYDEGNGYDTLFVGTESSIVMDAEAQEIFWNYLDYDWNAWDTSDNDGMFADVFNQTSKRIMTVTTTTNDVAKTFIIYVGVIAVAGIILCVVKAKYKRDKEKAQEAIDILNAPLDGGSSDALLNKYK